MSNRINSIPWKKGRKLAILAAIKRQTKKAWKIAKI